MPVQLRNPGAVFHYREEILPQPFQQLGYADKILTFHRWRAILRVLGRVGITGIAALANKKARKTFVAGNWKMNKTPNETFDFTRIKG